MFLLFSGTQLIKTSRGWWWSSSFCKLRDNSCFGILRESILSVGLVIILKEGPNICFGAKYGLKAPKLPKILISRIDGCKKLVDLSKWPQDLTYYGWSRICIVLRQSKVPRKYIFFLFWDLIMTKAHDFPYLLNRLETNRCAQKMYFLYFFVHYKIKFQMFPYSVNYISY